ncbi:hypothetical protein EDC01DRAFT_216831 [Geopyxis carbonaria]|nr:hypothetical protein EDC01DRAFT_216831 [Geopyxis carbonaria]
MILMYTWQRSQHIVSVFFSFFLARCICELFSLARTHCLARNPPESPTSRPVQRNISIPRLSLSSRLGLVECVIYLNIRGRISTYEYKKWSSE